MVQEDKGKREEEVVPKARGPGRIKTEVPSGSGSKEATGSPFPSNLGGAVGQQPD